MTHRPEIRADLRGRKDHASWREVYREMDVREVGHD